MRKANAFGHAVDTNHLAGNGGGAFQVILRARADLAEHNILRGATAQHRLTQVPAAGHAEVNFYW